jgi:uncharacterized SAM-dependent methyltransferase
VVQIKHTAAIKPEEGAWFYGTKVLIQYQEHYALFERITTLREQYPPRSERLLFERSADAIVVANELSRSRHVLSNSEQTRPQKMSSTSRVQLTV